MKIEHIHFNGWDDCIQITINMVKIVVSTKVGPRIISCSTIEGENLFYVNTEQAGRSGGDSWKIYGGHRFWCAPESTDFTYAPDNFPVQVNQEGEKIQFIAPVEKSGVQKTMEISETENSSRIRVGHFVDNKGTSDLTLSPWSLSVMRPGGIGVFPHNLDLPTEFLPSHNFSLWGYTHLSDPRWTWGNQYILLRQDPQSKNPQKIGFRNQYGWAAYAVNNQLFIKHFPLEKNAVYPDFNCNFESYTNPDMLELESLGPLVTLRPGGSTIHFEEWEVKEGVPAPHCEADVVEWIQPLIE